MPGFDAVIIKSGKPQLMEVATYPVIQNFQKCLACLGSKNEMLHVQPSSTLFLEQNANIVVNSEYQGYTTIKMFVFLNTEPVDKSRWTVCEQDLH